MSAAAVDGFDGIPSDHELVLRWAERSAGDGVFGIECTPDEWRAVVGSMAKVAPRALAPLPGSGVVVAVFVGSDVVTFSPPRV